MSEAEHSRDQHNPDSLDGAVLLFARLHPEFGQARVAKELGLIGHQISSSGVRYIWKRHNLETTYKRLKSLEKLPGGAKTNLTPAQMELLRRGDVTKRLALKARAARGSAAMIATDDKQDQILRAAAELFAKQGFLGTSFRDIARQVGMLPGSIYHYFPSKEDLFVAIHRAGFKQIVARSDEAIKNEKDPWKRLESACTIHICCALAGDAIDRITVIGLFAIHEPRLQKRLAKDRRGYEEQFRGLVDALDLPSTVNRSFFRLALLGALNWTLTWYRPGKKAPREVAHELVEVFKGRSSRARQARK